MKPRIVLALGGNALQKNGEATAEAQKKVAESVGEAVAELADKYEIIIAHGNGPQVGNILIHEESASTEKAPAMPLETAVAMSQGQIGYWLTQAIHNSFAKRNKRKKIATVISQVVVDRNDPEFKNPTKPIGQFYSEKEESNDNESDDKKKKVIKKVVKIVKKDNNQSTQEEKEAEAQEEAKVEDTALEAKPEETNNVEETTSTSSEQTDETR